MSVDLTDDQRRAVHYIDSPLLIVAGPGSGKTRVLTQKGIFLVDEADFDPQHVLMTTFTIKAAEEMRQRIEEGTSTDISSMFIGTVHSLCENIIRQFGSVEFYSDFQVMDDFKRYLFLKKHLKQLGLSIDDLKVFQRVRHYNDTIVLLAHFYDTLTENLVDIDVLREDVVRNDDSVFLQNVINYNLGKDVELSVGEARDFVLNLFDSFEKYEELLAKNKVFDFSHLESVAWKIMSSDEAILSELRDQFRYVLVDEFQDINPLQWKILSEIAKDHQKITCVGDRNQSIYGFRGANPNIFDQFREEFSSAERIELGDNFRSKKDIVDNSSVFLNRSNREVIDLFAQRDDETCDLYYIGGKTEREVSEKVLSFVNLLKEKDKISSYGEVALLFRSLKYHGKHFISQLNNDFDDIPYVLYGGSSFLENEEIRGILYLLSYVYSWDDQSVLEKVTGFHCFFDVLNSVIFDDETVDEEFSSLNWPVIKQKEDLVDRGFSHRLAKKIVRLNAFRERIDEKGEYKIQDAFYEILGILDVFSFEDESNKVKVLYNLGRFSEMIEGYIDLYNNKNFSMFIRMLKGVPDKLNLNQKLDEVEVVDADALNLMNIHQAKGLEFPFVIIPSLISRRFPNIRSHMELVSLPRKYFLYEPYDPLQEEQNLFYVAMTRAQDHLMLSSFDEYDSGRATGKSDFLEVMDDVVVDFDDQFDDIDVVSGGDEGLDVKLIDYSAISTFIDCPERFKINYLYGFKAQELFMQKVGLIYHNVLAKVNARFAQGRVPSESSIQQFIDEAWIDLGKDKNDVFRIKVKNGLKRYIGFLKNEVDEVVAIEQPVSVIKDNIRIRGRTDFLYKNKNGELVLLDYKSRTLKSINDTHVDLQLKFYADALHRNNQPVDKAVAYPIEEEQLDVNDALVSVDDGSGEVSKVLKKFTSCVREKSYTGSKKGSIFCKECPYRFMCKYYKEGS